MDDPVYDYDYTPTTRPHTGPIIHTPDVKGALLELRHNAVAMHSGDFNPLFTRRLLLRYLGVCRLLPYTNSCSFLEDVRAALVCHALVVPNGRCLSDDDPTWPAQVSARLVELGVLSHDDLFTVSCEHADHFPDHLWYTYSPDRDVRSELRVIDYFSRTAKKSRYIGHRGLLSECYEQCECGRWFRRLTVF